MDESSKQRLPHYENKANGSMRCSCPGTNNDDSHYLSGAIVGCREPFLVQCWLTEELNSDEGGKKKKRWQHPPPLALSPSPRLSFSSLLGDAIRNLAERLRFIHCARSGSVCVCVRLCSGFKTLINSSLST